MVPSKIVVSKVHRAAVYGSCRLVRYGMIVACVFRVNKDFFGELCALVIAVS